MILRNVVFTGGGTAGHVIPTKPLITELLRERCKVAYIGSTSGLEALLVKDLGVPFHAITTGKLRRYLSFENVIDVFRVPVGILQALILLLKIKPQVVFSKGGYVAFPVVFAAWILSIPVVAHESDLTPGLANRLCLPLISVLATNFAETRVSGKTKIEVTGTPIRESLQKGDAELGREFLGVRGAKPILLVFGGSLGAAQINSIVREALPTLSETYFVVHVCGFGNLDDRYAEREDYRQFEYLEEAWGDVLASADLVVSRAGANSVYELLSLGKSALLVPLSRVVSRGDQIENAELVLAKGWAHVIQDDDLTATSLIAGLAALKTEQSSILKKLKDFPRRSTVELQKNLLLTYANPS